MRKAFISKVLPGFASLALFGLFAPVLPASTLEIQSENVNSGEFAARIGVASACENDNHVIVTGLIAGGDFQACSSLAADGTITSGVSTFTAGDRVILREGFKVSVGTLTVEIDRDLYPDAWVQDDTPDGEVVYSARFYVNPTNLNLDDGVRFYHFAAFDVAGQPELRVGVKQQLTEKRLFLEVFSDEGAISTTENDSEILLLPGWHFVEVGWGADGAAYLCLDVEPPSPGCAQLSGLDNDTGAIDFVRWGAIDVPFGVMGVLDLDDFQSSIFHDGFESGDTTAWTNTADPPGPVCSVPGQYPSVQAAVSNPACLVVDVAGGTYPGNVTVERTLTLQGAGPADTVLAGTLLVRGPDTALTLKSFGIDTTGSLAGCFPEALSVIDGAVIYADAVTASNADGIPTGPCLIFADGFESGF